MFNWKSIFYSTTIAANCLLCFFLLFYDRIAVPSLLQVAGRAHPLILHFPIVLFALFIIWIWLIPKTALSFFPILTMKLQMVITGYWR